MATPKGADISSNGISAEKEEMVDGISFHLKNTASEFLRHECHVVDCIAHKVTPFECHKNGDTKEEMLRFVANIHFKSVKQILDAAAESVKRKLQQKHGRSGNFPQNRIVDVDCDGKFERTLEDKMEEIAKMSKADKIKAFNDLKAMIALFEDK